MHVHSLHPWDLSPAEAIKLQKELGHSIREEPFLEPSSARLIGGVDVSCTKENPLLTAGVIVWDRETGSIVDSAFAQAPSPFPYIPGLLSFRELPVLSLALEKLSATPDVLFVDGQGRAHPRRMGIAAHLGLLVDCPTLGVAKSRLCGAYEDPALKRGSRSPLVHQDEVIGQVLRTKDGVSPLCISVGSKMTLENAVDLVLLAGRGYRLPEPTRLAHLFVNEMRVQQADKSGVIQQVLV